MGYKMSSHTDQPLESHLPATQGDIKEIMSLLRELSRELGEVKMSIQGDTKLGIIGIVKRQDSQERDLDDLKKWRNGLNMRIAFISGFCGAVSFGGLEGVRALFHLISTAHP